MRKKRIVLLYNHNNLDTNIMNPVNYEKFEREWEKQNGGNAGNKLFISAVEQYVCQDNIEYGYMDDRTPDELNQNYDIAVLPLANILNANQGVLKQLEWYTELIKQLNMPVFIIGIGLQADSYDDIGRLAREIQEPVKKLLSAVYEKGGELALRGYATKELLDKIMPNTAVVTGCPSMYQMGPDLKVDISKVSKNDFHPAINGNLDYLEKINMINCFKQYENSVYLDQDEFAELMYFDERLRGIDFVQMLKLINSKTYLGMQLFCDNRIKLIYDIPVWMRYLKNFNYSCGSRIHGNIIAILAGLPATVIVRDARTRELAEYFDIPIYSYKEDNIKDIYELYLEADYSKFNKSFVEKYNLFESFLRTHGIVDRINDSTLFQNKRNADVWNVPMVKPGNIELINNILLRKKGVYILADKIFRTRRKYYS